MIHLGDITKINGHTVPIVDVIIGGSPCQDLSLAGKRAGLDGERSGLFTEQIRIVKEMREEDERRGNTGVDIRPRYMVWENVPGAFSSNKGEDFRIVLEETAKVADKDAVIPRPEKGKWQTSGCIMGDGWSFAWRVLDAQFFGTPDKPLPQRRRRIALVADFGGQSAPEILFVRKSVSGDTQPGEPKREGTSSNAEGSFGTDDREGACYGFPLGFQPENVRCYEKTATTLCNGTRAGFCNGVIVGLDVYNQALTGDKSKTLNSAATDTDHIPCVVKEQHLFENHSQDARYRGSLDVCPTLPAQLGTGGNNTPFVVESEHVYCLQGNGIDKKGKAFSLMERDYKCPRYIISVRRLTPLECERLQGFPDGWTDIGEWTDSKGKVHKVSDSARYKALGNSIAIPPWKWVLKRLCACYERDATMASLFDGIGGFPYIWEQLNGKGSCLWASEIEEFPMAVTKERFK